MICVKCMILQSKLRDLSSHAMMQECGIIAYLHILTLPFYSFLLAHLVDGVLHIEEGTGPIHCMCGFRASSQAGQGKQCQVSFFKRWVLFSICEFNPTCCMNR